MFRNRDVVENEELRAKERAYQADMQAQQQNMGMTGRPYSDEDLLNEIFKYHPPLEEATRLKYEALRAAARNFAQVILTNTPHGEDRRAALRHVREAVMTANAAVALNGLSF